MPRRCSNCGAPPRRGAARYCSYCGVAFPVPVAPPPSALEGRARALALLQEQPEFAEAMRRTPSVAAHVAGGGCGIAFVCLWIVGVLAFAGLGGSMAPSGPAGLPFVVIPLVMLAGGGFLLFTLVRRTGRIAAGKLEREPAVVVSQRSARSGDHTTDHATLEYENGDREEYEVSGRLAGRLAVGDTGVAYEKGGFLVGFTRIDVT